MEAFADETITASEYIARQTLQEIEAAVAAQKCCTYGKTCGGSLAASLGVTGIMQPVFSCLDCARITGKPVGVCEACMIRCHTEHEVVEVGVRRCFRCDCPTQRSGVTCVAQPEGINADHGLPPDPGNRYGHNFNNRFCSCDRAYDPARDSMVQCVACDEWYHDAHVPGKLPAAIPFATFVCASCVASKPFLQRLALYRPGVCGSLVKSDVSALPSMEGVAAASSEAAVGAPAPAPGYDVGAGAGAAVAVQAQARVRVQAWRACLTCSEGADDGAGVCEACATACHAGHVLTAPRITAFECDCCALGAKQAPPRACACNDTANALPQPELFCCSKATATAAAATAPVVADSTATTDATASAASDALPSPSYEPIPSNRAAGAALFLSVLCRCDDCMKVYAAHGVATWWLDSPLDEEDATAAATTVATASQPAHNGTPSSSSASAPTPATAAVTLTPTQPTSGGPSSTGAPSHAPLAASTAAAMAVSAERENDPHAVPAQATARTPAMIMLESMIAKLPPDFQTTYQAGLSALRSLPLTAQLDALAGYNEMSAEVLAFLRRFAESGSVVGVGDVSTA